MTWQPDDAELDGLSTDGLCGLVIYHWKECSIYAKWAGKRLPTEAEWDFAARGGLVDKEFPWGDDESIAREYANHQGTGGKDKWEDCAPVGSFQPNGYGLHDMAGNVFEWCQDWSSEDKEYRVLRGGSWNYPAFTLLVAVRFNPDPPSSTYYYCGFRCVSGLPAAKQ